MFLEICMKIQSVVFAISRQINEHMYVKTINLLCTGNKVFAKYLGQGCTLTPTPLAYALVLNAQ